MTEFHRNLDHGYPNSAVISDYLAYYATDARPNSVRTRRVQLEVISREIPNLADATEREITDWHQRRAGKPETRASYVSAIKGLYDWLVVHRRYRPDNPTAILKRPRIPTAEPRPMVERHYELALACAAADPELYLWLGLMGCSGFRCCEVAWLRVSDIERQADDSALAHVEGKGGKRRVIPVGRYLALTMAPFLRGTGTVFTRPSDGKAYSPSAVSQRINTFLRGLGIGETAHQLRHRFGTDYHAIDPDLYRQAKLMGHASVDTTQRYTEVHPVEAAKYIEQLTQKRFGMRRVS